MTNTGPSLVRRLRPAQMIGAASNCRGSDELAGMVRAEPGRGLSAAAHLQLLQKIVHVVLHGGGTNRQLTRDLLVGAALFYENQDLALAVGERWQRPLRLGFAQ
jgi:hypothetical protein